MKEETYLGFIVLEIKLKKMREELIPSQIAI